MPNIEAKDQTVPAVDYAVWTRSNGKQVPVKKMHYRHLQNAYTKLRKEIGRLEKWSIGKANGKFDDVFVARRDAARAWLKVLAGEMDARPESQAAQEALKGLIGNLGLWDLLEEVQVEPSTVEAPKLDKLMDDVETVIRDRWDNVVSDASKKHPPIHPITAVRFSECVGETCTGDAHELRFTYPRGHEDVSVILSEFTLHAFLGEECVHAFPISAWLEMSKAAVEAACEGLP